MAKQKAASDWGELNLDTTAIRGQKKNAKPASEWGEDTKDKTESSFYDSKGKQQSEWNDDAEKKKQESLWDAPAKTKQQSAWDDESRKEKQQSEWGDNDNFLGAKPREQSEWGDSAPSKEKAPSEWGNATSQTVPIPAAPPADRAPAKPKKEKSAAWGKSFRMSFGKGDEETKPPPPKPKPSKFSKPVNNVAETGRIGTGKKRPKEKEAWEKVPPPKSRDNRFSFGLSSFGDSLGFNVARKGQVASAKKDPDVTTEKEAAATSQQDSFFSLGSMLDPFGFFSGSDVFSQEVGPSDARPVEVQSTTASADKLGPEATARRRQNSGAVNAEKKNDTAEGSFSLFGVGFW
mmetsp:Transcript_13013/g.25684  ORF Transcript_13013/g.25684 Transcript_13013/m.25684 type:complete len:347 (-) Transcript_13013:63-1103(-)